MDEFLYDRDLRHEKFNLNIGNNVFTIYFEILMSFTIICDSNVQKIQLFWFIFFRSKTNYESDTKKYCQFIVDISHWPKNKKRAK